MESSALQEKQIAVLQDMQSPAKDVVPMRVSGAKLKSVELRVCRVRVLLCF